MILIFLSWILLFYCFIGFGVFGVFLFKIDTKSITKIILTGMVLQTILLTISAFFIPLNYQLFISNLIISSILTLYFRNNLMLILKITFSNFKNFDPYLKIIFFIILNATLFKCAQVPFILDN